jgi:cell wall-associated NlpC family hydrolase
MLHIIRHSSTGRRAVQHRRKTGPAALRTALGVLLACCALGGTALAAAGGAAGGASDKDPAAAVVQIARQQLGDPYAWGATGPDTWDCSGLTSRLWREVGGVTSIPRVSRDQQAWAVPIPVEQLLVGDLVFFGEPVSHVALYAGDGTIVDASSSQHQVVERRIWTSGVIRYGRVPRPDMPAVKPWTPPSPKPTPSASASAAATPQAAVRASSAATPKPVAKPTAKSVVQPTPKPSPVSTPVTPAVTTAAVAVPLRGFPGPDLPALTAVAAQAANNARTVQGSKAWTDVELVRAAWRHAGGQVLPTRRVALVAAGTAVPVSTARIGDLVVYGGPASHVGIYLGHGYMVDASPTYGRVVVRRVFTSPTVRIVRLP